MSTIKNIDGRSRMRFLPTHYGPAMMGVEGRVFTYAHQALTDYSGGSWDFAETETGAGVLIPPEPDTGPGVYRWIAGERWGGDQTDLSREAAGLALTTLAVNHELWKVSERPELEATARRLLTEWERLMETVYQHPESDALMQILD